VAHGHASGRAWITATPAPAPAGSATAAVTIRWSAPAESSVQVRVSADGGAQKLFAAGGQVGSANAAFIGAHHTYVFGLYLSSAARAAAASVVVKGH
jgi:hypothetical protein